MARQEKRAYELSDAEQRDLATLIQQGKALPEKYRFLLFEDKREVELVWNGKTWDVCTTVLPFQTLDDLNAVNSQAKEALGYATQKPEGLLERIIKISTSKGEAETGDWECRKVTKHDLKRSTRRQINRTARGSTALAFQVSPFANMDYSHDHHQLRTS